MDERSEPATQQDQQIVMMTFFCTSVHSWKTKTVQREIKSARIHMREQEKRKQGRRSLTRAVNDNKQPETTAVLLSKLSSESPVPSPGPCRVMSDSREEEVQDRSCAHSSTCLMRHWAVPPDYSSCLSPNVTTQYFPTILCDPSNETTVSNSKGRRGQKGKHLALLKPY